MIPSCPNCGEKVEYVNATVTLTEVERRVSGVCRKCGEPYPLDIIEGKGFWKRKAISLFVFVLIFLAIVQITGKDAFGVIKVFFFGY